MPKSVAIGKLLPEPNSPVRDEPLSLVEVVLGRESRADLTIARDLAAGLDDRIQSHIVCIGQCNVNCGPAGRVHHIGVDATSTVRLAGLLRAMFRKLNPAIVHTHNIETLLPAGYAARREGVPLLIHTIQNPKDATEPNRGRYLATELARLQPLAVAANRRVAEVLSRAGLSEAPPVITPGIDTSRYTPGDTIRARRRFSLPPHGRLIGCATPLHDFHGLLDAVFHLDQDTHLVLFGLAEPDERDRIAIRRRGLESRVHVIPESAEPALFYRAIDVYAHGPTDEIVPRPVLAAQSCGKPVITVAPVSEETLCPKTGWVVPIDYPPALLSALRATLSPRPGASARNFILDHWDAHPMDEAYAALFQRNGQGRILGGRAA